MEFQPDGHPLVVGMLIRYNRKTVTVVTDTGQRWNVAPPSSSPRVSDAGADNSARKRDLTKQEIIAIVTPNHPLQRVCRKRLAERAFRRALKTSDQKDHDALIYNLGNALFDQR